MISFWMQVQLLLDTKEKLPAKICVVECKHPSEHHKVIYGRAHGNRVQGFVVRYAKVTTYTDFLRVNFMGYFIHSFSVKHGNIQAFPLRWVFSFKAGCWRSVLIVLRPVAGSPLAKGFWILYWESIVSIFSGWAGRTCWRP